MSGNTRSATAAIAIIVAALALLALAPAAGAYVYWGNFVKGTIGRAENDGGGVNPAFITGAGSPQSVAVDANHIYWGNEAAGSIGRANIDGTGVDPNFIPNVKGPNGVAVTSTSIYWAAVAGGSIGRAKLDGTSPQRELISGLRHELRASPARDEPEEDLRTREVPHGRRDRAVVAVERDLHSPAERRPVDRRDGDERQLADPAEELVPGLPAQAGSLGCDLAELADVGADREHERLAREEQPSPVPGPELIEHTFERAERDLAECVRPLPVLAVVHRHERDRTDARGELPELELRGCASHRSGGSPRGSRRPCPSRCRAR